MDFIAICVFGKPTCFKKEFSNYEYSDGMSIACRPGQDTLEPKWQLALGLPLTPRAAPAAPSASPFANCYSRAARSRYRERRDVVIRAHLTSPSEAILCDFIIKLLKYVDTDNYHR
ncbi:unnamed protein product [Colias eurytheme]|nr:unnamed protein product [Colias eurytheme]